MSEQEKPLFERLSAIDVSDITEKKNNLTYLSWAHAWRIFKTECPDATYSVSTYKAENRTVEDTILLPYMSDMNTGYMCHTTVTAEGDTHEMWLPVMDYRNKALKGEDASMFDVNKTIMRCLVKNLAMFGLGIYIYAGEDLPNDAEAKQPEPEAPKGPQLPEKWSEWAVPWSKSPRHKQTLGEIVMEGDTVEDLMKMRKYIKDIAKKKEGKPEYDYWCAVADFVTEAVTEAQKNPDGEKEGPVDPNAVDDSDVPF